MWLLEGVPEGVDVQMLCPKVKSSSWYSSGSKYSSGGRQGSSSIFKIIQNGCGAGCKSQEILRLSSKCL